MRGSRDSIHRTGVHICAVYLCTAASSLSQRGCESVVTDHSLFVCFLQSLLYCCFNSGAIGSSFGRDRDGKQHAACIVQHGEWGMPVAPYAVNIRSECQRSECQPCAVHGACLEQQSVCPHFLTWHVARDLPSKPSCLLAKIISAHSSGVSSRWCAWQPLCGLLWEQPRRYVTVHT